MFDVDGAERLRIDSSGNLLVGVTSTTLTGGSLTLPNSGIIAFHDANGDARNTLQFVSGELKHGAAGGGLTSQTFYTSASERMRIDSSGNLLVGKTSIDSSVAGFEVDSDGKIAATRNASQVAIFHRLTDDGPIATFRKDGATVGSIGSVSSDIVIGTGDTGLRFVDVVDAISPCTTAGIQTNAQTDIGRSSFRFKDLHLSGTANVGSVNIDQNNAFTNTNITSANTNTDKGNFLRFMQVASGSIPAPDFSIGHAGDNTGDAVLRNVSSSSMKFYTNNTEKARIDASGNLLVGKTATSVTTLGIEARANGLFAANKSGGASGYFGRHVSDGNIVEFRKDGTTVGSIGSEGGDSLYIVNGDTGLRFVGGVDSIVPSNANGAARDAAIDLGFSSQRFKDLYLSGGVYLGGTGSANKLDDYEEGTWTPTILSAGGGSNGSALLLNCTYTKTGNRVLLTGTLLNINTTSMTAGGFRVAGLPFAAVTSSNSQNLVSLGSNFITTDEGGMFGLVSSGGTLMVIYNEVAAASKPIVTIADITNGNGDLFISMMYQTTA